jgi:hypothetical protein
VTHSPRPLCAHRHPIQSTLSHSNAVLGAHCSRTHNEAVAHTRSSPRRVTRRSDAHCKHGSSLRHCVPSAVRVAPGVRMFTHGYNVYTPTETVRPFHPYQCDLALAELAAVQRIHGCDASMPAASCPRRSPFHAKSIVSLFTLFPRQRYTGCVCMRRVRAFGRACAFACAVCVCMHAHARACGCG